MRSVEEHASSTMCEESQSASLDFGQSPGARFIPRYRKLADHLREQISSGVWQPGDRLPTEIKLMAQYGVSRNTVRSALDILRRQGLVDSRTWHGTTVRPLNPNVDADHGVEVNLTELAGEGSLAPELLRRWAQALLLVEPTRPVLTLGPNDLAAMAVLTDIPMPQLTAHLGGAEQQASEPGAATQDGGEEGAGTQGA
jgi:DNA-binding transcriptional regulator YhcF (GntR family)